MKKILLIILVIILIGLYLSVYVVDQGQQAVVLRMGKPIPTTVGNVEVAKPGLHIQYPLFEATKLVDMSMQNLSITVPQLLSSDQQAFNMTLMINWKVQEAGSYYQTNHNDSAAMEAAIKKAVLPIVQSMAKQNTLVQMLAPAQQSALQAAVLKAAAQVALPSCVQVQGVQITSITLSDSEVSATYQTMQSNFAADAAAITAQGNQQAQAIKAQADQQAALALQQVQVQVAQIRAKGDASAALIEAKAYQQDPDFYQFYRSLQAYQNAFDSPQDVLVLQPKGLFFKNFNPMPQS